MKKTIFLSTCAYILFALTGCGQTGPLYLPEQDQAESGSTIVTSGSSLTSTSVQTVDDDPSKPTRSSDSHTNELVDNGDNFGFDKNIQYSSNAEGTPS